MINSFGAGQANSGPDFPLPKTTRWRPGSYKQILYLKWMRRFEASPKENHTLTCSSAFRLAIGSMMPGSTIPSPARLLCTTYIQGRGLPIWKSFSNSCDRNCTSKNSGSCVTEGQATKCIRARGLGAYIWPKWPKWKKWAFCESRNTITTFLRPGSQTGEVGFKQLDKI